MLDIPLAGSRDRCTNKNIYTGGGGAHSQLYKWKLEAWEYNTVTSTIVKNNTPKTGVSATEVEIVLIQYITISADKQKTTTKYPLNQTQKYLILKLKTA